MVRDGGEEGLGARVVMRDTWCVMEVKMRDGGEDVWCVMEVKMCDGGEDVWCVMEVKMCGA